MRSGRVWQHFWADFDRPQATLSPPGSRRRQSLAPPSRCSAGSAWRPWRFWLEEFVGLAMLGDAVRLTALVQEHGRSERLA